MQKLLFIILLALLAPNVQAGGEVTVLQWNVWQEGTMVKGGYDAIVDEIVKHRPDFVTLSEVRNYHGTNFAQRIVQSLREQGETYYSFYSYDSGLLSRYPIADSLTVFPCEGDHGSIYRLLCEAHGRKFAVYTAHLDYQDCTYYEVRGYDGNTWRAMAPLTDVAEVLRRNDLSRRDDAIRCFLAQAEQDAAEGYSVVIGGDFNEPSHFDWTCRTRYMYDHHGLVVPWTVSRMLADAGFADAYRAVYPNELTHPGFTYPADNALVDVGRLTWAPLGDERERIDFILYKGAGLSATEATLFGPEGSIAYSQRRPNPTREKFIHPQGVWPTDHKGVFVTLRW